MKHARHTCIASLHGHVTRSPAPIQKCMGEGDRRWQGGVASRSEAHILVDPAGAWLVFGRGFSARGDVGG